MDGSRTGTMVPVLVRLCMCPNEQTLKLLACLDVPVCVEPPDRPPSQAPPGRTSDAPPLLCLTVRDLAASVQILRDRGATVDDETGGDSSTDIHGQRLVQGGAIVRDPDGNAIQLQQYPQAKSSLEAAAAIVKR